MGKREVKPKNSLLMKYPEVMACWDYDKNVGLDPLKIYPNADINAHWKCPDCGAEWEQKICYRIRSKCTCPYCQKERRTSFNEQAIYFYVKKFFLDAINNDRHLGLELDIYIPSIKLAIEYDGEFSHGPKTPNSLEKDLKKNKLCAENGIKLIRIRELGSYEMESDENLEIYWINKNKRAEFKAILVQILETFIYDEIDIDLKRDEQDIIIQYKNKIKENSLAAKAPHLLKEFDYEKNKMKPETIPYGSKIPIGWICPVCGYHYPASPQHRTDEKRPTGCPVCNGSEVVPGYNDFETWCKKNGYTKFLDDWDYSKNKKLPSETHQFAKNDNFFICHECGKPYQKSPMHITESPVCPNCAKMKQSKRILCKETGIVYDSIKSASMAIKMKSHSGISECLNGKRETAGGYHWEQVS